MAYRPEPDIIAGIATVVGRELHVPRGATLPKICLKCGTRKKVRVGTREVTWVPAGAGDQLVLDAALRDRRDGASSKTK